MKKNIILAILAFALALLSPQIAQAQGTIYVSTLGLPSTGSASVGSDLWLAESFLTGNNAGGYLLNSVQLALANALGNPSGFRAMLYTVTNDVAGDGPGSSLGTLNGSLDPVAAGIYAYSPASGLTLSPQTKYYIVLTAGTAVADGAYEWSVTSTQAPTLSGGWAGGGTVPLFSSAGLNWGPLPPNYPQFAISATAVPEPGIVSLLALGAFFLVRRRRKSHGG